MLQRYRNGAGRDKPRLVLVLQIQYLLGMLRNIRFVLVGTTHPGNIGAAARAMKTMGLGELYLVAPRRFPHAEASARASGADDVLASARVCPDLDRALADCRLVFGTSARLRSLGWPQLDPRECAQRIKDEAAYGSVAVVFGREHSGLSNAEMDRCHFLVHIPCDPQFSSLNLGAAVQVLSYEIRWACVSDRPAAAKTREEAGNRALATAAEMQDFYAHLEQALVDLGFLNPTYPRKLMRQLRRLFNRARPDQVELNILRGILSAAQGRKSMGRGPRRME